VPEKISSTGIHSFVCRFFFAAERCSHSFAAKRKDAETKRIDFSLNLG
jgi:hypothetical protein